MDLNIFLTGRCNFACKHCNQKRLLNYTDMTLETAEKLSRLDYGSVCFLGGEPTLHPHFRTIAKMYRHLRISTNGTNLDALKDIEFDKIGVSVDAACRYTYAKVHNSNYNFHILAHNLRQFNSGAACRTDYKFLITDENYKDIYYLQALLLYTKCRELVIRPAAELTHKHEAITAMRQCGISFRYCHNFDEDFKPYPCRYKDNLTFLPDGTKVDCVDSNKCKLNCGRCLYASLRI